MNMCAYVSNCLIRDNSSVGVNVELGFGVEIKNSIILGGTRIGRLSFIGDSIIGYDVEFGAGTMTWNNVPPTASEEGNGIKMNISNEKISVPLEKFGCIIGSGTNIGINCSIYPGTKIGEFSLIAPGIVIDQDLESRSSVELKQSLVIKKIKEKKE